MKYFFFFLLFLYLTACSTKTKVLHLDKGCVAAQVETYGDLCAESSSGYETMSGPDAHFEGVKCAVESINICIENK